MLKRLLVYFTVPAIILHELSHIVFGLLSGYIFKLNDTILGYDSDEYLYAALVPKNKRRTLFQSLMVSLSPLYLIFAVAILGIYYPAFMILFTYLLICHKFSFPSKMDLVYLKHYKLFSNYDYDNEKLQRFLQINEPKLFIGPLTLECPDYPTF